MKTLAKSITTVFILPIFLAPFCWVNGAAAEDCSYLSARLRQISGDIQCRRSKECAIVQLPQACNVPVRVEYLDEVDEILYRSEVECPKEPFQCLRPARGAWCRAGRCVALTDITGPVRPDNGSRNLYGRPYNR